MREKILKLLIKAFSVESLGSAFIFCGALWDRLYGIDLERYILLTWLFLAFGLASLAITFFKMIDYKHKIAILWFFVAVSFSSTERRSGAGVRQRAL